MGAKSRRKGARGELRAAAFWKVAFPGVARRSAGEESQLDQGRDLKGTPGFCVQVEEGDVVHPHRKMRDAVAAARPGEVAFAHLQPSQAAPGAKQEPPFCVIRAWDLRFLVLVYQEASRRAPDPVIAALNRMGQARADGDATC